MVRPNHPNHPWIRHSLTTTFQWLCCGADIADDGKLCYLQGVTKTDYEITQTEGELDFRKVLRDFFRFCCARFISGVFAVFNFFLSCLYIVSFPKILASRFVASLRGNTCKGVNKPVNCEVIRSAPLHNNPFINRICSNLKMETSGRDHQNHHLPLVFVLQ